MRLQPVALRTLSLICILIQLSISTGCSIRERTLPLSPLFLDGAPVSSSVPEVPFQHAWIAPRPNLPKIDSIYIKPVRSDIFPPETWKRSRGLAVGSKETFDKDAAVLARYFRIRLISELNAVKTKRFKVIDKPAPNAVILEIAFTELVLSEPLIRAAALAAPLPGVDVALSAISDPHVSFAARFTTADGKTLLATVGDRRFPPLRIIDLNKLTARSSAREIIAQWSRELAESIQLGELTKVERSSWFSLLPW